MNTTDKIRRFCYENSFKEENLFVEKLRLAGLTNCEITTVIDAMETTCHHCWDSDKSCQCENDDKRRLLWK